MIKIQNSTVVIPHKLIDGWLYLVEGDGSIFVIHSEVKDLECTIPYDRCYRFFKAALKRSKAINPTTYNEVMARKAWLNGLKRDDSAMLEIVSDEKDEEQCIVVVNRVTATFIEIIDCNLDMHKFRKCDGYACDMIERLHHRIMPVEVK